MQAWRYDPLWIFFLSVLSERFRCILNVVMWLTLLVLDLVLYFCVLILSTLVPVFGVFPTSGISWGCASGVASLIVTIFIFDIFPVSGCNC